MVWFIMEFESITLDKYGEDDECLCQFRENILKWEKLIAIASLLSWLLESSQRKMYNCKS